MIALLVLCSTVCVLTGLRMIFAPMLRGLVHRDAKVPAATVVRDGRPRGDGAAVLRGAARFVAGVFLVAIGVAVIYIVEGGPL